MERKILNIVLIMFLSSYPSISQTVELNERFILAEQLSQKNPDSSKVIFNELLGEAKSQNKGEDVSLVLNELGVLEYYHGDYKKALDYYIEARSKLNPITPNELYATIQSNIGAVYKSIGMYEKALKLYREALQIDRKMSDSTKVAVRLNNIAGIYANWAKYDLAIEYYQKALEIDKSLGNREEEAIRYGNIGVIYYRLNENALSLDFLKRALVIDKELKNDFNTAIRLNNLGRTCVKMNETEVAIEYYREAIDLNLKHENLVGLSVGYNNLGEAYFDINKDSTEQYFKKALLIAKEIGSISREQKVLVNLAKFYYSCENYEKSIEVYDKSLRLAKELKLITEQATIIKSLSEVYQKTRNYTQANVLLEEYILLQDSIFKINSQEKIANFQIKFSIDKKEREIDLLQKEKEIQDSKILAQRWAIIIIVAVIIFIILLALALYRNKVLKSREDRLALESYLNKYMQKAYRQQMNPHFIFNTLNSIQSFILQNDKESSSKYLSKFAQLMRMVLENSEKDLITIKSELEAINLYVELEKLRFDKKITVDVKVDSSLMEYKLPPLIFQPFIENSIWHGFMHKEGNGKIEVMINVIEGRLVCEIIDDGIGKEAAEKYKKKEHKSFGMSITQRRLELINTKNKEKHNIVTEDLFDTESRVIGTKVTINLPLIDF